MNGIKEPTIVRSSSQSSSDSKSSDYIEANRHVVIDVYNTDEIVIDNIQGENNLIDYTDRYTENQPDSRFNLRNEEQMFEKCYVQCDSPITMSNYGSRNGSNPGSSRNSDLGDNEEHPIKELVRNQISLSDIAAIHADGKFDMKPVPANRRESRYKQLAYHDIERSVEKYYDMDGINNKYSNEIDILTTFMKGQKNLYIQSKRFSNLQLNALMIPSILITGAITVISPFLTCEDMSKGMITIMNGIAALCITLLNYLKLETSTEMYLQMANYYDKMETMLEMASSSLIVIDSDAEKKALVLSKIQLVEQKMIEAKETNGVLIPEQIKTLFPIISHINVFSFIKKMETHKQMLIYKLKDVKNEIRFILYKWKKLDDKPAPSPSASASIDKLREQNRLEYLYGVKDKLKFELMDYRTAYGHIDEIITREINSAEKKINVWGIWYLCCWGLTPSSTNFKGLNPVIDRYFHFIFADE
jgi:hypothetical protein